MVYGIMSHINNEIIELQWMSHKMLKKVKTEEATLKYISNSTAKAT